MSDSRHVQTELDPEEYAEFRELAERQGGSIKEALREAVRCWMAEQQPVDASDPLFEPAPQPDEPTGTPRTDATELDPFEEDWRDGAPDPDADGR